MFRPASHLVAVPDTSIPTLKVFPVSNDADGMCSDPTAKVLPMSHCRSEMFRPDSQPVADPDTSVPTRH